jgi:hypothetical protein
MVVTPAVVTMMSTTLRTDIGGLLRRIDAGPARGLVCGICGTAENCGRTDGA